jgi:hypothetical protein
MDREAIEDMLETMLIGDSDQRKLRRLLVDYEREMQRLRKENEWLKKVLEDCEKKRVDEKSGRVVDMTKPSSEFCYLKTLDWVAEISKKTNEVVQCCAVTMTGDYRASKGCMIELAYAREYNIPVFFYDAQRHEYVEEKE